MQAALRALTRLGWTNAGTLVWFDETGVLVNTADPGEIRDTVVDTMRRRAARQLERRDDTRGLGGDIDVHGSLQMANIYKKERKESEYGAVRCVMAGCQWPQERRFRAYLADSAICLDCGSANDDVIHRAW